MIVFFIGMALVIFAVDVLIKQAIEEGIEKHEERLILDDKVIIRRVHNEGMAMNLCDRYPRMVELLSVISMAGILIYDSILLCKKRRWVEKTGMMFLTGGALSNTFDRVCRGKVIDYIGLKTKSKKLTQVTFNIGDIFIVVGSVLVCVSHRLRPKKKKKKE